MKSLRHYVPKCIKDGILKIIQNRKYDQINKHYTDILARLKYTENHKRVLLIGTSVFGNLGDQAISIAEMELLKDTFPSQIIIEIPISLYLRKAPQLPINSQDLLIINGGGYMGSLWIEAQRVIDDLVTRYPDNHIVIMPQSVYYSESSEKLLNYHKSIYNKHKNLTVFVRDQRSLEYVRTANFHFKNLYLTPDIVTYLDKNKFNSRKSHKIQFILRNDQESIIDNSEIVKIKNTLKIVGYHESDYLITDSAKNKIMDIYNREDELERFLSEIGKSDMVISDRLHGAILPVVMGLPVIILDNISKKTFGAYQWFEDFDYVLYYKDPEIEHKMKEILVSEKRYQYDKSSFSDYHTLIQNVLLEEFYQR